MKRSRERLTEPGLPHHNPAEHWVRTAHFVADNGRHVEAGTELSVTGQRGRFRFIEHVLTQAGAEWISVIGGPKGVRSWRSFRPEQVKRVHLKKHHITPVEARSLVNDKNAQKRKAA